MSQASDSGERIDSAGLVYASNGYGAFKFGHGTVVFEPSRRSPPPFLSADPFHNRRRERIFAGGGLGRGPFSGPALEH